MNKIEILKKLKEKPESYWLHLLKQYFIDAPCAVIKGVPSKNKQKELAETEQKRVSEQIKNLGPSGLDIKEKELKAAFKKNEVTFLILKKKIFIMHAKFNCYPLNFIHNSINTSKI